MDNSQRTVSYKKKRRKHVGIKKIIIAILIPLVILIVIASIFAYLSFAHESKVQYCEHWSANIANTKAQLQNQLFPSDSDRADLNNQIDQFNKECAY